MATPLTAPGFVEFYCEHAPRFEVFLQLRGPDEILYSRTGLVGMLSLLWQEYSQLSACALLGKHAADQLAGQFIVDRGFWTALSYVLPGTAP